MMPLGEAQLTRLCGFVAERLGLHFPPDRWPELCRAVERTAEDLDFVDSQACVDSLLSGSITRQQVETLADHLTVGETYFFRDAGALEALAARILPEIIRARHGREQRLRIWSAGCCTGEEAYSLAILLYESWPELHEWDVRILGTDVSGRFLARAAAGVYREWSFRGTPAHFKKRWFTRTDNGHYSVVPHIRRLVSFAPLNLVEEVYPSAALGVDALDVIFCRNVLMYFTLEQTRKVIARLHATLLDGGWLVVSPSEASASLFPQYLSLNLCGALLFQRSDVSRRSDRARIDVHELRNIHANHAKSRPAPNRFDRQNVRPPTDVKRGCVASVADERAVVGSRARSLANEGKLAEARTWCDRWIALDKLNPAARHLSAMILLEAGRLDEARSALQRALYLDPAFALAHFALGTLARRCGDSVGMQKHFTNTLHLLNGRDAAALLIESDGLTAGDVIEIIHSIAESQS